MLSQRTRSVSYSARRPNFLLVGTPEPPPPAPCGAPSWLRLVVHEVQPKRLRSCLACPLVQPFPVVSPSELECSTAVCVTCQYASLACFLLQILLLHLRHSPLERCNYRSVTSRAKLRKGHEASCSRGRSDSYASCQCPQPHA